MVTHFCNPSYLGGWGRRIAWTWEAEVAVSQHHTIALQPGWWAKLHPRKKEKKNIWVLSMLSSSRENVSLFWQVVYGRITFIQLWWSVYSLPLLLGCSFFRALNWKFGSVLGMGLLRLLFPGRPWNPHFVLAKSLLGSFPFSSFFLFGFLLPSHTCAV